MAHKQPFTNRLANQTSPYLLQHKHNPVDWFPWGNEAFEKARREDKPLLISIGYSACHWCHVMERECFENPEIAALINQTVVPVKVDREERPDVDAIYMNACVALTGQGGWPLNAFTTPDLKPFFVGTYLPPEDRYGRPGLPSVLKRIAEAWKDERQALEQQAHVVYDHFRNQENTRSRQPLASDVFQKLMTEAASDFDDRFGGFGRAPKFPPDQRLAALLAYHCMHNGQTSLGIVTSTLDHMAAGGICDHLGGGFCRYSVDEEWLIPHFEKMLYNQALLVPVYLDAQLVTGNDAYGRIAADTLDWTLRDMRCEEGLFFCALDADSEGHEGKYYVWTPAQVQDVLGREDAPVFCDYYGVSSSGNFEHGSSVLHTEIPLEQFAVRWKTGAEEISRRLEAMRQKLLVARYQRVPPGLDDKCITAWNGLMITALARAHQVLGGNAWLAAARTAADFLLDHMLRPDGSLMRCYCKGQATIDGLLDDYAFLAAGLITLYETCFDNRYLFAARDLLDHIIERFQDKDSGALFLTGSEDPSVILRTRELHDNAMPAPSSVAAMSLLWAASVFEHEGYRTAARQIIEAAGPGANKLPAAFASLILASLYDQPPAVQIVFRGSPTDPALQAMLHAVWHTYLPARTLAWADPETEDNPPLASSKNEGKPCAYVCRNQSCRPPAHTPEELKALLEEEI